MKLDEKGAVPIPYIIALVLGVVVIALVSYWLFMSGGEFGKAVERSSCQGKKMTYCSAWKLDGKKPGPGTTELEFCSTAENTDSYAPECCTYYTILTEANCDFTTA